MWPWGGTLASSSIFASTYPTIFPAGIPGDINWFGGQHRRHFRQKTRGEGRRASVMGKRSSVVVLLRYLRGARATAETPTEAGGNLFAIGVVSSVPCLVFHCGSAINAGGTRHERKKVRG